MLPESDRLKILNSLTSKEALALQYDWQFWARPNQLAPGGDWEHWLLNAGRGFGKSRVGAEWIRQRVESGKARRIHFVAPTAADVRDTMVEGESGILAISPPWNKPLYEPSKRRLTWPNGAIALLFSAEEPDRLRGPQCDTAWCDELAAWKYPDRTWDMLQFGLRLGDDPRCVITTTPRPIPLIKSLLKDKTTYVTTGSTYDNKANLAKVFIKKVISKYEGTRLGRQELNAEILEDNPDALWQRSNIEKYRVFDFPDLVRIVVGVDPAVTSNDSSDDTGIIVAGIDDRAHAYVLGDYTIHDTPLAWAKAAISAYHLHKADRIIGEVNNGGDLVETTMRTIEPGISYSAVHASRGKAIRAEPYSSLYEQGKVHHVGQLPKLEDELCDWIPGKGKSPNRLDALVWALTELLPQEVPAPEVSTSYMSYTYMSATRV